METNGSVRVASRRAASRPTAAVPAPRGEARPDVGEWAELREHLAARAAELQQSALTAAESARRYDAVGDHLLGGMQWRKAHLEQVRLAELERTYAVVDDLARRTLRKRDGRRGGGVPGLAA